MERFSYKAVCGVHESTLIDVWTNGFRLLAILMLFKTVIIIATIKELKNNICVAMWHLVTFSNYFKQRHVASSFILLCLTSGNQLRRL